MALGFAWQHPVIAFYVLVFILYLVAWGSLPQFNFDPKWQAIIFIMSGIWGPALAAVIVIEQEKMRGNNRAGLSERDAFFSAESTKRRRRC